MFNQEFSCLNFYEGKSILVTGTTGFVGKVLLEKALRVLNFSKIYILIRTKKGQDTYERFSKEIMSSKCFDRLRNLKGDDFEEFVKKVIPIDGDLLKPQLGLSPQQRWEITENVHIIINSAASVDFNASIKQALEINYFGTKQILELAKECKNLENLIHISTAYVNADKSGFIEEHLYHPQKNVEDFVDELYKQSHQMNDQQQKVILGKFPNTYTFTKSLAEQMLLQLRKENMQITIMRPTIVGSSLRDPFPGWIDSLVGASATMFFAGLGMMSVFKGNDRLITDQIPVDYVVDHVLVAGAYEANKRSFQIYHIGSSARNPIKQSLLTSVSRDYWTNNVPQSRLRPFHVEHTTNEIYYRLKCLQKRIPALLFKKLVDQVGTKEQQKQAQRYLKLLEKADFMNDLFCHFNSNEWVFSQDNTIQLMRNLRKQEQTLFQIDVQAIDWISYVLNYNYGLQKFILKENVDLPIAQEPNDLLSCWKSSNFADVQWFLQRKNNHQSIQQKIPFYVKVLPQWLKPKL